MRRAASLLIVSVAVLALPAYATFQGPATGSAAAGPEVFDTRTTTGGADAVMPPPRVMPNQARIVPFKLQPPPRPPERPDAVIKTPPPARVSNLPILARLDGLDKTPSDIADPALAVGRTQVVEVVNSTWAVFDKSGRKLFAAPLANLFAAVRPPASVYQAQSYYDAKADRFVIAALGSATGTNVSQSVWLLAVSQQASAIGRWWVWKLNAGANGDTPENTYAGDPALGFNDGIVALTANMFSENDASFRYAKVRLLDKLALYEGRAASFVDYWNLKDENGRISSSVRPARAPFGAATLHFANIAPDTGSVVTLWRADMIASRPTLMLAQTLKVRRFDPPPDAFQRASNVMLSTGPARVESPYFVNGSLYLAFAELFPWIGTSAAGVRYLGIKTAAIAPPAQAAPTDGNVAVVTDVTIGNGLTSYFNPSVTVDRRGNAYLIFNFSGQDHYPSVACAGWQQGHTLNPPMVLRNGVAPWGTVSPARFGGVTAVALDPELDNFAWACGEYVREAGAWSTSIDGLSFDPLRYRAGVLRDKAPVRVKSDSLFKFGQTVPHWNVVALRSAANWRLETWDANFTTFRARSSHELTPVVIPVELCVADGVHSPLDTMGIKVSSLGPNPVGTLEFHQGQAGMALKADALNGPFRWHSGEVVRAFDLHLSPKTDTCFALSVVDGNMDLGMAIFQSNNAEYYASRYDAVAIADNNGPGQGEYLTFRPPMEDDYGIVTWSNNLDTGNFTFSTACQLHGRVLPPVKVDKFGLRVISTGGVAGEAKIAYDLPTAATLSLRVYDAGGRLVRTIAGENHAAGSYEAAWDGRDASGRTVAAGTYYVRLESPKFSGEAKLVRLH